MGLTKTGVESWKRKYDPGKIGVIRKTRFPMGTKSSDAPSVARGSIPVRSWKTKVKLRASNYHRIRKGAIRLKPLKPGSGR
jgi:hypothetical protein